MVVSRTVHDREVTERTSTMDKLEGNVGNFPDANTFPGSVLRRHRHILSKNMCLKRAGGNSAQTDPHTLGANAQP